MGATDMELVQSRIVTDDVERLAAFYAWDDRAEGDTERVLRRSDLP